MKLNEIIEKVKGNVAAFPDGLETDIETVRSYLAVVSVEPLVEKFAKATSSVIAVAENINADSGEELSASFDAVSASLNELRTECLKAVDSLGGGGGRCVLPFSPCKAAGSADDKEKGDDAKSRKAELIACRKSYAEKGCKRIEIVHPDGNVSAIRNGVAIAAAMGAIVREIDRQIASA